MADKATIIVHSGDMDKIYSALIIGNGALAMGMEVSMYLYLLGAAAPQEGGAGEGASLQDAHAWAGQVDGQAQDEAGQRGFAGEDAHRTSRSLAARFWPAT